MAIILSEEKNCVDCEQSLAIVDNTQCKTIGFPIDIMYCVNASCYRYGLLTGIYESLDNQDGGKEQS